MGFNFALPASRTRANSGGSEIFTREAFREHPDQELLCVGSSSCSTINPTAADLPRFANFVGIASMGQFTAFSDAPFVIPAGAGREKKALIFGQNSWKSGSVVTKATDAPSEYVARCFYYSSVARRSRTDRFSIRTTYDRLRP